MAKKGERIILGASYFTDFDDAVGDSIDAIAEMDEQMGPGGRVDIHDTQTGRRIARLESGSSSSSVGYTRRFGAAWDRMIERRNKRRARGQRETDD